MNKRILVTPNVRLDPKNEGLGLYTDSRRKHYRLISVLLGQSVGLFAKQATTHEDECQNLPYNKEHYSHCIITEP